MRQADELLKQFVNSNIIILEDPVQFQNTNQLYNIIDTVTNTIVVGIKIQELHIYYTQSLINRPFFNLL